MHPNICFYREFQKIIHKKAISLNPLCPITSLSNDRNWNFWGFTWLFRLPQSWRMFLICSHWSKSREIVSDVADIYFFEMNTKYISSSVLKTSEFSQVRSTSENSDVFNSRNSQNVFNSQKIPFLYFWRLNAMSHSLRKEVLKMQKKHNFLSKPKWFWYQNIRCVLI